jgi:hypothetical protein
MLGREGLPWRTVDLLHGDGVGECSVVVVTAPVGPPEREVLTAYLRGGGAVLAAANHVVGLGGTSVRHERLDHIIGDGEREFPSLRLIDLDVQGCIPREADHLRTQTNTHAVFAGTLAGGVAVLLPFDPAVAMTDTRVTDRAFYARSDRLPSERVSRVSRGEVSQLVHHALAFLHHARSLPYLHLWYYPRTLRNVLTFRIDTDGAPRRDIDDLYRLLKAHDIPGAWFLDVAAHEPWLGHFATLEGQEIGLHCYRHRRFANAASQEADWRKGLSLIRAAGLSPAGMAAPYGAWTPDTAHVIDRLGLEYSSEFAYAYDTLPVHPCVGGAVKQTLQLPIHPVSTGSLRRAGYTPAQMATYFMAAADALLTRDLPLAFYHHPTHGALDVFASLFAHCRTRGIETMRMDAWARWWTGRAVLAPSFSLDGDFVAIGGEETLRSADTGVHITFPNGEESYITPSPVMDLRIVTRERRPRQVVPEDIRAIREFDPRRAAGDLFVSLLRRLT